jgi:hypothetical protein
MHRSPRLRRRRHILPVLAIMLLVGHVAILYQVSSKVQVVGIVASGAVVLLVLKHFGLFGLLYAMVWRRIDRGAEEAAESDSSR